PHIGGLHRKTETVDDPRNSNSFLFWLFFPLYFLSMAVPDQLTKLLIAWTDGDAEALDQLVPAVFEELHRLAKRYMAGAREAHTLQATALVNEAFMRLIDGKNVRWQNRAHFIGVAAKLMRHVLVDHARSRRYAKRGAAAVKVTLDEGMIFSKNKNPDLLALDD